MRRGPDNCDMNPSVRLAEESEHRVSFH